MYITLLISLLFQNHDIEYQLHHNIYDSQELTGAEKLRCTLYLALTPVVRGDEGMTLTIPLGPTSSVRTLNLFDN